MRITLSSVVGIALSVWQSATRTLTANPANPTTVGARPSVSAGAVLDLRPAANKFRQSFIGGSTTTGWNLGVYDGSNYDGLSGAGPDAFGGGVGNSTAGFSYKNTSGGALTVQWAGFDITT